MTKIYCSDILVKVSDDICLLRLVVRTSGFHPDNSSSILLGDVSLLYAGFFFALKNCINNYGPLDSLFNKDNISNEEKNNIMVINEKLNSEKKKIDNNNAAFDGKMPYVISNNPDSLDIKLNQYLKKEKLFLQKLKIILVIQSKI